MNSSQRLLRVATGALVLLMVLFPPFLVRNDAQSTRWLSYSWIGSPPYPPKEPAMPTRDYCPATQPYWLALFVQIGVVWMLSSFLYERLGRAAFDRHQYPEYYRP